MANNSNNISWLGNRVVDTGKPRQSTQSAPPMMQQSMPSQSSRTEMPRTSASESLLFPQQPPATDYPSPMIRQGPPPSTEQGYIPYYLKSNIGKMVRAEFIIGSSQYTDRTGKLIEVGINYFVLEDINSRTHVMCDLYSVKFVTILQLPPVQ